MCKEDMMKTKEPELCHGTGDINTLLTDSVLAEYNLFLKSRSSHFKKSA